MGEFPRCLSEPEVPTALIESEQPVVEHKSSGITSLKAAAVLVSLSLLVVGSIKEPLGVTEAEAQTKERLKLAPAYASTGNPKTTAKECSPRRQIKLSLVERRATKPGYANFALKAVACKKTTPKLLKDVKLSERGGPKAQKRTWKVKTFPAGKTRKRNFSVLIPEAQQTGLSMPVGPESTLILKATSKAGKQLGQNEWRLKYRPGKTPGAPGSLVPEEIPPDGPCRPSPDFHIVFQDDAQVVMQKNVRREKVFELGSSIFGATAVRINMIWGAVQKYGMQPYIDAVDTANRLGFKVQITIMPTPTYNPEQDQALNSYTPDPELMRTFARNIASTLGNKVTLWSVYNEPNHVAFNATLSMTTYNAVYLAGRAGILDVIPSAKMIAGELAPANIPAWMDNLNMLPNNGTSIHAYGSVITDLVRFVRQSKTPLYITEYGNFASDSNQMTLNREAAQLARCAGVKQLAYLMVIRDPGGPWDAGVVLPPVAAP